MKAHDLFTIILKITGLYLIKEVLFAIPPVFRQIGLMFSYTFDAGFFSFTAAFLQLLIFGGLVYLLLFHTGWIIRKLQLTRGLSTEPMPLHLHRASVLTIAILIAGLVILAVSVPRFIYAIYTWTEFLEARKLDLAPDHFDYSALLTSLVSVLTGLLFLGNHKLIIQFIEVRRKVTQTTTKE